MAGYIGSKAVNLSTTGADIAGDADVSGDLTVDTSTLHVDSTNNRVGVGTSSPSDVLHVVTPTFGGLTLECTGATADPTFKFLGDSGNYWSLQQDASQGDSFQFRYNNSEKVRIDSSGNLLVGATTVSSLQAGTVDGIGLRADAGARYFSRASTSARYQIQFMNPNGNVGRIETSGSSTSYITSSDYRLKTDAQPMTGASARVQALNPVNFEWIADGTRVDGFLAHEAQEVGPEAVTGTKDAMLDEEYEVTPAVLDDDGNVVTEAVMGTRSVPDYQGIDQSKLVPLLTAALQEALTKIDDMEARLAALEAN